MRDYSALLKAARAATRGKWRADGRYVVHVSAGHPQQESVMRDPKDAMYLEQAYPDRIIILLEELNRLEEELGRMREFFDAQMFF